VCFETSQSSVGVRPFKAQPLSDLTVPMVPVNQSHILPSHSGVQVRQAAIESISQIIDDAKKRIQPTGLGELFAALKARLNDSNKNLVVSTLAVLGSLAAALGPGADKTNKVDAHESEIFDRICVSGCHRLGLILSCPLLDEFKPQTR
jgi:hypothetical protein